MDSLGQLIQLQTLQDEHLKLLEKYISLQDAHITLLKANLELQEAGVVDRAEHLKTLQEYKQHLEQELGRNRECKHQSGSTTKAETCPSVSVEDKPSS